MLTVAFQPAAGNILHGWFPIFAALGNFLFAELGSERSRGDVDGDDVAIFQQADEATLSRLRGDVTDAGSVGRAGKAAIGNESDGVAEAFAHDVAGGCEHLLHAGTALGTFIANDHHIAGLHFVGKDAGTSLFLALENNRRTAMHKHFRQYTGFFHDSALLR